MPIEQIKDFVDYGIIGFLFFLSFITVAYGIERVLFYRSIRVKDYSNKTALELDITKRLPTIASIGSNAPYIGLLGTVLAIILTFYIIGSIVAAIVLAIAAPSLAARLTLGGEIFLRLLQMVVVPLVMASVMSGILGLGDVRKLGRPGAAANSVTSAAINHPRLTTSIPRRGSGRRRSRRPLGPSPRRGAARGRADRGPPGR